MKRLLMLLLLLSILLLMSFRPVLEPCFDNRYLPKPVPAVFAGVDDDWVDSVFNTLSQDEKIAQLLMVPAYSNKDVRHEREILRLIEDNKIGGLIFMQGHPVRQVQLVNKYQAASKVPLLIGMDAEWSLSMRLDSVVRYPRQMLLGAICHDSLLYDMGCEFAEQLKRVGVHINFAPVVDVNNNADNPVINDRSFGENKYRVAYKGYLYAKGLQDRNILACAKHFPGHGDTDVDSHQSMPVLTHDLTRLDTLELYPFKYLIDKGIASVLVSHLFVPALDSTPNVPATLSPPTIKGLLKGDLGFEGLVVTDAMNMGGITRFYDRGKADVLAIVAGNDIILFPSNVDTAISKIKQAVANGQISQNEIDNSCKKILKAKCKVGLNHYVPIRCDSVYQDLNSVSARLLQERLVANAITVVQNRDSLLPISDVGTTRIATLSFGTHAISPFQKRIDYYASCDHYVYNNAVKALGERQLLKRLAEYDLVLVSVHNTNRVAKKRFGISSQTTAFVDTLTSKTHVVLDIFANAYGLSLFHKLADCAAVLVSYNDWALSNDLSAQVIFGGIAASGRLPVSAGGFAAGSGCDTRQIRLRYTDVPESAGINSQKLYKVDSIMRIAIANKMLPGGQIAAAHDGAVFYLKSFGHHTYDKEEKVGDFDLYDLASVTKVMSTVPALMRLYDQRKYSLDDHLSRYLTFMKKSDKRRMKIDDILTHRAGLRAWIPYYLPTIVDDSVRSIYYSPVCDEAHDLQVADSMFVLTTIKDTIFERICDSRKNAFGRYVYSDLGFYLFPELITQLSGVDFVDYVRDTFFVPLGADRMCFLPLSHVDLSEIAPTEDDTVFRRQQVHGFVHDQGAAMMGGISGHAGLFACANDVTKMLQMCLQGGIYGGRRYVSDSTLCLFTRYRHDSTVNRRGLGWDKPCAADRSKGPGSECASRLAFGHTGFTGTLVWADPACNLAYVFLSNRVYPDADNKKIVKSSIRTKIEEIFYQSIIK